MPTNDLPSSETEAERREVENLLAALEEASRGQRPVVSRVFLGCLTILNILIMGVFSVCSSGTISVPVVPVLVVIGVAGVISIKLSTSREQKRIVLQLLGRNDKRIIGPLILAHNWPDLDDYRGGFRRALILLLPQLQATDTILLNEKHRAELHKELTFQDEELVIAILKALGQVGDESSLRHVERLAKGPSFSQTQWRIQEAAQQCLSALLQSVENRSPGSTLLRPSEGNPTDVLLRPITPQKEADPELLLRPGSSEPTTDSPDENDSHER
jgi:hypothetical protein